VGGGDRLLTVHGRPPMDVLRYCSRHLAAVVGPHATRRTGDRRCGSEVVTVARWRFVETA
jgi:hypothetical protein